MFGGSKHKYENLRDTAEDGENSTQYAPKSRSECLRAAIFGSVTPWVISTVVFSFLSAFLATKSFHPSNRIGTFETGFSTDIGRWRSNGGKWMPQSPKLIDVQE